jgi:hypothetical protein
MAHLFGQAKSERIIFDTSALNWLADDDGADALIGRLVERFTVRLSQTNIGEFVATSQHERRDHLLKVAHVL